MNVTELTERQARQYIDAEQARKAWLAAGARAINYRGSMYWKTVKGRDYLCREYNSIQSKSLGLRSPETERILLEFKSGKEKAEHNLKRLNTVIATHARLNVALRVGRAPNVVIGLLEGIRNAGLQDHFLVIGTNALYAYETHAGVRFGDDVTATTDIDLLWDSRKKITLVADGDENFNKNGLIGVVKKFDSSFYLLPGEECRAANADGYMIDLVKRRPSSFFDDHEHPQLIKNQDDFWAAKITNMDWLLSAPKFKQVVVGVSGRMAEMTTVDPRAYALYKVYLSEKSDRDPTKVPRDIAQARAVYRLVQERMPHMNFDQIHAFPERLRNERVYAILNEGADNNREAGEPGDPATPAW